MVSDGVDFNVPLMEHETVRESEKKRKRKGNKVHGNIHLYAYLYSFMFSVLIDGWMAGCKSIFLVIRCSRVYCFQKELHVGNIKGNVHR